MKDWKMRQALLALTLAAFAGLAFPQTGEEGRGSAAPGDVKDGSRPGDGAITGGSILPGEKGGTPDSATRSPEERTKRCNELSGALRDECLLKERDSSVGGTKPSDAGGAKDTPPADAPPPQNPR